MKYRILYNPLAGEGDFAECVHELELLYGAQAECYDITKIDNYADFFAICEPDDKIVVSGGDGTLNRFVNSLCGMNVDNEILYYAQGSGNDFMRDVMYDVDASKPFPVRKYIENLPIVEINGKDSRFINGVGYGIDGYCCEVGDKLRAQGKRVNYTAIAIKGLLFGYKPCGGTITVDGVPHRYEKLWIAPTMNGKYYGGGMMACPEQNRCSEDGEVSVLAFHDSGKLRTLMIFPSIFKGEHIKSEKHVTVFKGREVTVEFDEPRALQIDGETVLGVKSYTVKSRALVSDAAKDKAACL